MLQGATMQQLQQVQVQSQGTPITVNAHMQPQHIHTLALSEIPALNHSADWGL